MLKAVHYQSVINLISKDNKVVLTVADTPAGAQDSLFEYLPVRGPLTKLKQTSSVLNSEKERKGPAEEALQAYTAHMKDILAKNGLLK